ncbi:hypothetical protein ACHAXT_010137 [Thalassiosira profunda]
MRAVIFLTAAHAAAFTSLPPATVPICNARWRASASSSDLTDWVIENLEDDGSITSADPIKAGEGDTLPAEGLEIGKVRIYAASQSPENGGDISDAEYPIYLLLGRNGWGTGVHPSTRLCLEWICNSIRDGDILLDYGCGSGILSIASLHMGGSRCIGVDVEAEALVTAERNFALNGFDADGRFQGLHTREVLPYEVCPPRGADVCVANILIGQLVRPSMVAAIVTNLKGGLLCLSGIRPGEIDSLKEAYGDIEWLDDQYAELSADETTNCIETYGFDCGRWARLVGRKKTEGGSSFIEQMSDLACQLAHWDKHKAECKLNRMAAKRECTNLRAAAELFDEALYNQSPPSDEVLFQAPPPRDDCPICFHPLPLNADHFQYQPCCASDLTRLTHVGTKALLEKRMEVGDPEAFHQLGIFSEHVNMGSPKDSIQAMEFWAKGAEMGSLACHVRIGHSYMFGRVVEKSDEKAKYHYQMAALGGNIDGREMLGTMECNSGNMRRAMRHWMIAAKAGSENALSYVAKGFADQDGHVTLKEWITTLAAFQEAEAEMKSEQRDKGIKVTSFIKSRKPWENAADLDKGYFAGMAAAGRTE